jgi:hypothetical protein
MWFKRSRKSATENRSEFVGLPSIPDPIDDNLYLASAVKAAIVDKESGAYDEFLFSENGITEMPFEESLESHLGLVSHRIADQGRRELLIRQQSLLEGQSRVALAQAQVDREQQALTQVRGQLEKQIEILSGERIGKDNLIWKDTVPEFSSSMESRFRLLLPLAVFLFVGFVDIRIIFESLLGIPGFTDKEAILFAIPAVGIQLFFPHFIGERIRANMHGSERKKRNNQEILILGILWIMFCATLTYIRLDFINKQSKQVTRKILEDVMYNVLGVMNFLMLIGLGTVLIFLAVNSNPHFREFHRMKIREQSKIKNLQNAEIELEKASNQIPLLQFSNDVTKTSFEEAAGEVNQSLSKAAKKVYRRALVNKFGEIDFTNSYLNSKNRKNDAGDGKA